MEIVHAAVQDALRLGAISADAVWRWRVERRSVRLFIERCLHLPVARIGRTGASDYMALTTGRAG